MHRPNSRKPLVAIACGGTGGHFFPGLAVAEQLIERGCGVTLLVSPKEVDQRAAKDLVGMEVVTLPAVGLTPGRKMAFLGGLGQSYKAAKRLFKLQRPQAALAMGGFTSAAPILAAKLCGMPTFLHESNTIPGRANRWLSWVVNQAFVGFPMAADGLNNRRVTTTGTPVRPQFKYRDLAACRLELGLDPERPVIAVIGGSQGASGLNEVVMQSLPLLAKLAPQLQWFHLSGPQDAVRVAAAYRQFNLTAMVHPFFEEMDLLLGAATVAISRAGASSLAELAAVRVPAVLVPYPAATDNHQFYNARALENSGAAHLLEQKQATPERLVSLLMELVENPAARQKMRSALGQWHAPKAAETIAERMLQAVSATDSTLELLPGRCPQPYRINA
jgi:UDP-N-acetylglucosamine--N-acetylmuramyl-(pentapeptide) pyrophosphoryl-undecaprenol N-acetylglucosamine transferase